MLYALGPRARHVYDLLLDRIRSGELTPGARLPPHTRLADAFGVAPLTMRRVVAQLEGEGLLARERGRGTFVRTTGRIEVLIVARSPDDQAALLNPVRSTGRSAIVAATPAEGLAALEREPSVALLVVNLALPIASAGLHFVRAARRERTGEACLSQSLSPPICKKVASIKRSRRLFSASSLRSRPGSRRS